MSGLQYKLMRPMCSCKGLKVCPINDSFVSIYYTEDFTLKSPKVTVNKELQELVSLKISQKLTENFQIQNYRGLEIYYNTNITLAVLYIFFTNNTFTKT